MNEHDNWDRHWFDLTHTNGYNPGQSFRRELVIHWLKQVAPEGRGRLLDIGSGQGDLLVSLERHFPDLVLSGAEMSAIGIEQSRVKAPGVRFYQRDLSQAPGPDDELLGWASLAVCCEVLEHVDDPALVLAHAARYLAPGGRLFITVPGGPTSAFDRHIGHREHFTPERLTGVVRDAGLIPEKVTGVGFPFFNLYRMTVILRGKALIKDAAGDENQQPGLLARAAMRAYSLVLRQSLNSSGMGWQMTAQVRKPEETGSNSKPQG